jgi:hypothetical protein
MRGYRRSLRPVGLSLVLLSLVGITAAGCSSSKGTSSSPATTQASGDGFLTQVRAICKDMKTKGDALNETAATSSGADEAALVALFDQNSAILRDAVAQMSAITPSASDAAAMTDLTTKLRTLQDETDALVAALKSADQAAAAAATPRQAAAQHSASEAARAMGLDDCALG